MLTVTTVSTDTVIVDAKWKDCSLLPTSDQSPYNAVLLNKVFFLLSKPQNKQPVI